MPRPQRPCISLFCCCSALQDYEHGPHYLDFHSVSSSCQCRSQHHSSVIGQPPAAAGTQSSGTALTCLLTGVHQQSWAATCVLCQLTVHQASSNRNRLSPALKAHSAPSHTHTGSQAVQTGFGRVALKPHRQLLCAACRDKRDLCSSNPPTATYCAYVNTMQTAACWMCCVVCCCAVARAPHQGCCLDHRHHRHWSGRPILCCLVAPVQGRRQLDLAGTGAAAARQLCSRRQRFSSQHMQRHVMQPSQQQQQCQSSQQQQQNGGGMTRSGRMTAAVFVYVEVL